MVRLLAGARDFFLLQSVPLSFLFFPQGVNFSRYETRHSPHLVSKIRISGITGVPPLPLYVLMTCTGTTLPETGSYSPLVTGTRKKSGDRVFGTGVANVMTRKPLWCPEPVRLYDPHYHNSVSKEVTNTL